MGFQTQSIRRKTLAVGLTVVPGLGHVALDRHGMGVFLFTVFAISANGAFAVARLWVHPEHKFPILLLSTVGLALVYPYAFISIWRLTFGLDEKARALARAGLLKMAVRCYLRGEDEEATVILKALLRQDGLDVDSLFYLGMVQRDRDEKGKARRTFRRCASLSPKWRWEAAEEIRGMNSR